MATYVNNLRLKEIATGDESGTWGTSTNLNLELIGEALGVGTEAITTNADTHDTVVADGLSDAGRAFYLKYTGTLDSACTITISPNTMKRVQIIENATSGSQNIIISQGSGANVTIAPGKVAVVQLDGAGSGAAVTDALTDLAVTDSLSINGTTLTVGDGTAEDTKLVFDGNAQDYYIGLDDSADDLVIGLGSAVGTTPAIEIDENQDIKFAQSIGVGQAASSTTGDIVAQTMSLKGTTPTLTIGDAGAEDTKIVFDGNAKDFYVGLDDSADKLVIGEGSTVGTNNILTITDDSVTIGDGAAVDSKLVFDGNAQDFYIGLDDSADDLIIGSGSTVGTTPAITIDENQDVTITQDLTVSTNFTSRGIDDNADATAITINSSEQVGIGTTSPTVSLQVTAADGVAANNYVASFQNQEATDGQSFGVSINAGSNASDFPLNITTHDGGSTLMRLKGSAELGIGTGVTFSNPLTTNITGGSAGDSRNQIAMTHTGASTAYHLKTIRASATDEPAGLVFMENTTERMRIDSNGRLNLGAVAHFADINQAILNAFINSSTIPVCRFAQGSTTTTVPVIRCRHENSSNGFYIDFRTDENAVTGTIKDVSGTMTYASASDSRLKNNVETIPEGLTEVLAMNPVKFTWHEKKGGNESRGFLAQELNNQYPWAVQTGGDDPHTDPWQADYGKLTPVLVKAVQELKAELDAAKARIETLENA